MSLSIAKLVCCDCDLTLEVEPADVENAARRAGWRVFANGLPLEARCLDCRLTLIESCATVLSEIG
jgi:hypothetical protein